MIPKPTLEDIKTIGYYTGRITVGYGFLMTIPIFISFIMEEYDEGINFFIGLLSSIITGYIFLLFCEAKGDISLLEGMVIASFSWLVVMFLGTIPFMLSGHFASYIDGCFDVMSGLATIGLSLIQDLDHTSYSLKMWRFILPYVGGQGMVLIALTFLVRTSGVYGMYVGEGREDRILPNIVHTARVIWGISLGYFCIWTLILWIANIMIGFSISEAFWQGMWLFMGSWSTSGFASYSSSIIFYHSLTIEIITMVICILGSFNFAIHYSLISGNRKEIYKNIEIIVFCISFLIIFFIITNVLSQQGVYTNFTAFLRKVFYLVVSAHTTAGHTTLYSPQFFTDWGAVAMICLIIAMAIGGSTCSTAGGIKVLRIGILIKGIIQDIKLLGLPKSAVMREKLHHIKDIILDDRIVRGAMFTILCFLFTYGLGAFVGVCCGYPLLNALFDAVSAGSSSGLSCGVVSTQMPFLLKVVYIFEMWVGRLEFMSIFALINFIISTTQTWHSGKRVIR